eukprot:8028453-Ditylum_brightwellii.AAC.1
MGGIKSPDLMKRLKKWFYYGVVKRNKLSVCKIAIVGQKLPVDCKEKMVDMRGKVKRRQLPTQQTNSSMRIISTQIMCLFGTNQLETTHGVCETVAGVQ